MQGKFERPKAKKTGSSDPPKQDLKELNSKFKSLLNNACTKISTFCFCKKKGKETPRIPRKPTKAEERRKSKAAQDIHQTKIFQSLLVLEEEEKINKAIRHFHDALLKRTSRHDIDGGDQKINQLLWRLLLLMFIFFLHRLVNSTFWNNWLWFLSIGYQMLTFFEPVNQYDKPLDPGRFRTVAIAESFILFFYLADIILNGLLNIKANKDLPFFKAMFQQKKLLWKLIFFILVLTDFLNYINQYPLQNSYRFSRIIRPFLLISYSKELRRNLKGILGSIKNLVILFLFYFIVMGVWAFIGTNIIGDITGEITLDTSLIDYSDFFKLFNLLFMLSTLDFYPDIMMPTLQISYFYTGYFIPYLLLFMFLFMPIPLALVYEGYRQHRVHILIVDQLKQKEALLACFLCLDLQDQGFVGRSTFFHFLNRVYSNQLEKQELHEFYSRLDQNESGKISIEEFFNILQVIDENKKYTVKMFPTLEFWIVFRAYIEQKFKLRQIIEGEIFSIFMFLVTIVNCSLIITSLIIDENTITYEAIQIMDIIFFTIYFIEVIIKIIAYGIHAYFDDSWNNFDFFLVIFQLVFDYILYNLINQTFVEAFKANRVLRVAKIQKVFRLFRAFRTIKVVSVFMVGMELFNNVKDLFIKILICVPIVLKQITLIWIVFYIYAVLSVELYSSIDHPYDSSPYSSTDCSGSRKQKNKGLAAAQAMPNNTTAASTVDWSACSYADFNTLYGAFLLLLQIFTGNLSTIEFDLSHKIEDVTNPAIFFGSFVFISIFLLALLCGLIWEVFTIVEDLWKEQREQEQKQLEREEKELLEHELMTSELQIPLKKKKSMLLISKTLTEQNEIKQGKETQNNFTLDILADDNDEAINFTDSDNFCINDQFDQPPQNEDADLKSSPILEDEEKPIEIVQKSEPLKITIAINNSSSNTSSNTEDLKLQQQPQQQEQSKKLIQKILSTYDDPQKYLLPDLILTQTIPVIANSKAETNQQVQIEIMEQPENQELVEKKQLVKEFIKFKFFSIKEFTQRRRSKLATEGYFGSDQNMNSYYFSQVKDDLRNFEQFNKNEMMKDVNIQNHGFLIDNALLKGANQKEIRKQELNHFFKMFGHQFERLREMKVTSLLQIQSRLMFHLHNTLKFRNMNVKFVFQVLLSIESLITNSLLPGCSFCKLIFGDDKNNFYYFSFDSDRFLVKSIDSDIWGKIDNTSKSENSNSFEDLDNNILVSYDFFNNKRLPMKYDRLEREINQLYSAVKHMGMTVSRKVNQKHITKQKFYSMMGKVEGSSQLPYAPVDNISVPQIRTFQVLLLLEKKEMQCHKIFKVPGAKTSNIPSKISNRSNQVNFTIQNPNNNSMDQLQPDKQQEEHENHQRFQFQREQMDADLEVDQKSPKIQVQTDQKIKQEQEEQEYFKDEDQHPYLPFPYMVELLKDILQVAEIQKYNLFSKASQMIHLRKCYSHQKQLS